MIKLIKMLSLFAGTAFAFGLPNLVLAELGSAIRKAASTIAQSSIDLQTAGMTTESGITGLLLFCVSQFLLWRIRRRVRTLRALVCMLVVAIASMGLLIACGRETVENQSIQLSGKQTNLVGANTQYDAKMLS